jgi:hypothetical protein
MFASAIVRRIAYVVVAALFALFGLTGKAHAQAAHSCSNSLSTTCDQGQAIQIGHDRSRAETHCQSISLNPSFYSPSTINNYTRFTALSERRYYASFTCKATILSNGNTYFHPNTYMISAYYKVGATCSTRTSETTLRLPLGGSTQCINGCMMSYRLNADDETSTRSATGAACIDTSSSCTSGQFYNSRMAVCQPLAPECKPEERLVGGQCLPPEGCPDGMVAVEGTTPGAIATGELYCKPKQSECPPGNIKAPSGQCLPGEGQCAVGEAKKPDGTCGKDNNADGVADDIADDGDPTNDSFSGGDTCTAPPSCSGGPIDCGMARIMWRIDCNTRTNENISGGSCGAVPICTGEKCRAMEYSILLQTWKAQCHLEKIAGKTSDEPGTDEPVSYDGSEGETGNAASAFTEYNGDVGTFDATGRGWGNSCPVIQPVTIGDRSISFDTTVFCDWMRLGGVFVMIMAHLAGLSIVIRGS